MCSSVMNFNCVHLIFVLEVPFLQWSNSLPSVILKAHLALSCSFLATDVTPAQEPMSRETGLTFSDFTPRSGYLHGLHSSQLVDGVSCPNRPNN